MWCQPEHSFCNILSNATICLSARTWQALLRQPGCMCICRAAAALCIASSHKTRTGHNCLHKSSKFTANINLKSSSAMASLAVTAVHRLLLDTLLCILNGVLQPVRLVTSPQMSQCPIPHKGQLAAVSACSEQLHMLHTGDKECS